MVFFFFLHVSEPSNPYIFLTNLSASVSQPLLLGLLDICWQVAKRN